MATSRRRFILATGPLLVLVLAALLSGSGATPGRTRTALAAPASGAEALFDPAVVRDYQLRFSQPDWEALLQATGEDSNVKADLTVESEVYEEIGARYKGLSSSRVQGPKKPFNLSIDAFTPGQRLMGYDTVNLNNGYADPSFVREALSYTALRDFMPTPQTAFVRLHINGAYFALYLGVEQIERTFLDTWFPDSDGILIKGDPPAGFGPRELLAEGPDAPDQGAGLGATLTWQGEDLAVYRRSYEVKTQGAADEGYAHLRDLIRVLDAPVSAGGVSDADFPAAIQQVLDVDRTMWYFAANNLFVNFDSYYFGHNYFLYWVEEDQRFHILLWDTNMSFGSFNIPGATPGGAPLAQADLFHMSTDRTRPLIRRLLRVPEFQADYLAHYRTLLAEAFDPAKLQAMGTEIQTRIRPDVEADPNKLYDLAAFDHNLLEDVQTAGRGGRAMAGVIKLATERQAWLKARADLQPPDQRLAEHARTPEQPDADNATAIRLRFEGADQPAAARLIYRVDDGPPVAVDLAGAPGVPGPWTGAIPAQPPGSRVAYYVRTALADGRSTFYPAANLTRPWTYVVASPNLPVVPGGDLVINELMADNDTVIADPAGEFDDWVELYNRGTTPISLKGYFLAKDDVDPWDYALPDLMLPPGSHYLVWCDKDPEQGADHAPFRLGKDGDGVRLSTRTATVAIVTFGPQATDKSYARAADGADDWITCGHPTPRQANQCEGGGEPTPATPTPPDRYRRIYLPTAGK